MMKSIKLSILFIVTMVCCSSPEKSKSTNPEKHPAVIQTISQNKPGTVEVIPLNTGREFRFKGMSLDLKNGKAYLGSWDQKQIVVIDLKRKAHQLIPTKYSGRLNGMGVYLKDNTLYAVMNEVNDDPEAKAISVLLVIDTETLTVLRSYEAVGVNGRNHFNHVVVNDHGIAYVSNTLKSSIYTVDTTNPEDSLKELVQHADLSWVHGIDITPDGTKIFSTAYDGGIKFYDLKKKTLLPYKDLATNQNDGLKYYRGYLYGIGEGALKRYTLNKTEDEVISTDVLLPDHQFFNDPRCLHIEDGWIYILANIEFDIVSFRGGAQNTAKDKRPFTDTYILKYKI